MENNGAPGFYIGEVIDNKKTETYRDVNDYGNDVFLITVRPTGTWKDQDLICRPANINIKQIPLIGEHVLIFQANNDRSSADVTRYQWYYFPAYNIQSNINHNALPGVAQIKEGDVNPVEQEDDIPLGKTFKQRIVSAMQPYEGDLLLEGRWGNSIRLSSTLGSGAYSLRPTWSGTTDGDPIIILSNSTNHTRNRFITEHIKNDQSSLYLTSTQTLSNLVLSKQIAYEDTKENQYSESQIVGVANRIILQAKDNNIILDSKQRITLLTDRLMLGDDSATEPLVLGEKLEEILKLIIAGCRAGTAGSPFYHQAQGLPEFQQAYSKIKEMLSTKVYTI